MNVLLYAPDLTGHPQVYCRVIADALAGHVHRIVLACGRASPFHWEDWSELAGLRARDDVQVEDCSNPGAGYLSAESLRGLQHKSKADVTIFIEADKSREEFVRIGRGDAPRLSGRNLGIFARTSAWYPGEEFYSGARIPRFASTLRGNLGRLKRALLSPERGDGYFFEQLLIKRRVIDAVIVKDERVSERFSEPVHWMPEIFRPFTEGGTGGGGEAVEEIERFEQFHGAAGGAEILLFFGTGSWYRGYDLFLQLLESDPGSVGAHVGAPYVVEAGKPFACDPGALRARLRQEGRLFETGRFVEGWALVDHFYGKISRAVSTHRLTASSGTVLQAMAAGKPVLVPATGLLGYRQRRHGLGPTYRYAESGSLANTWREFREEDPQRYLPAIGSFMERFSRENVETFFRRLVLV